ncbi:LOW QUALITY PROTEIN: mediator complex subunit 13 C-terminal-domain-containing protein [Copromyces sp. CBS 386.78]|nr:LOW QUALITY PROTEIN: mediator complex subunit 13 C-terminal-domain-containing protein [Copromyces sp. CBS 386.78]
MDTGDYDTNTLLINNLSAIAFRVYEPVAANTASYTFQPQVVEDALRRDGHLVHVDTTRRCIWVFYLTTKNGSSLGPEERGLTAKMEVCGYSLGLSGEGGFEPSSLFRSRQLGTTSLNTPNSSSSAGSAVDATFRNPQASAFPTAAGAMSGAPAMDNKGASHTMLDSDRFAHVPIKEKYDFFITATLASLSSSLCHTIGAIPLDHRSILLPSQAYYLNEFIMGPKPHTSALGTFRVYLTSTGTLVISLSVSLLEGLASFAELARSNMLPSNPVVLAAPLGAFGSMMNPVDGDSGYGQSPDTQISRLRPDPTDRLSQWKATLLQMRGISPSLIKGCSWFNRKPYEHRQDAKRAPLTNPPQIAPWPSVLCFRKPKIDAGADNRPSKALVASVSESLDPVDDARQWCQGFPEREETIAKRKKEKDEREALAAVSRSIADADSKNNQISASSPMALRRPSNGGAIAASSAMYPTPPDGIQPLGMASSVETGFAASPANHPQLNAMAGIDAVMQNNAPHVQNFGNGWESGDIKREQQAGNLLEGDNMFGDLGEDMFEGNELTDADFNFFDEQLNEQPEGVGMNLAAIPELGTAMDLSADTGQPTNSAPQTSNRVEEYKPIPQPAPPEFTKPELKHARSTLAEGSRQQANQESFNRNSTIGIKRQSSPFNRETVYKRIKASLRPPPKPPSPTITISQRRRGEFEKVDFDPSLSLVNKKYTENGPFNYMIPAVKEMQKARLELQNPLVTRVEKPPKEPPTNFGALLARIAHGIGGSLTGRDELPSETDDSSWASDRDDSSDESDYAPSLAKSGISRRRLDDDVLSTAASFKDLENIVADAPAYGSIDLVRLSHPEVPEFSIAKYFADPEPARLQVSCSDMDFITIAQILTEQVATGSLQIAPKTLSRKSQDVRKTLAKAGRHSMQGLRKALPRSLADAVECSLKPYADVQDVPLIALAQPQRIQAKPMGPEVSTRNIYPIPTPHIEIRRYETPFSMLPTAISFWESLGLSPAKGTKDIVSVCVFPNIDGIRDSASAFLQRIRSVYESLKLGTFDILPTVMELEDGLLAYTSTQQPAVRDEWSISPFDGPMSCLADALMSVQMTGKNYVVFFVYPDDKPSSVVETCAAFHDLYERYKRYNRKPITSELVLQLVPLDSIASETTVTLCLEAYDRCTLFAPAIVLEPQVLRAIDFKLNPNPSPNLLQENSCMHVAYAQSVDERWVTAAWTDYRGTRQMTTSRDRPLTRSITEIIQQIWETTMDHIHFARVHWRVVCSPMEQQEIDYWASLQQSETYANVSLTLLTVDTNPSLQLIPPAQRIQIPSAALSSNSPASTPQASVLSPDQSGLGPPTPIGTGPSSSTNAANDNNTNNNPTDADADSTLIDQLDMTWAVIAAHRLNNSTSLTELNQALASGYLVKRGGPKLEDVPVNVIHCEGTNIPQPHQYPRVYEALLKEMLSHFRGLGTLARTRGVVDRETDVRPWHVAAAEKAVRALYMLM